MRVDPFESLLAREVAALASKVLTPFGQRVLCEWIDHECNVTATASALGMSTVQVRSVVERARGDLARAGEWWREEARPDLDAAIARARERAERLEREARQPPRAPAYWESIPDAVHSYSTRHSDYVRGWVPVSAEHYEIARTATSLAFSVVRRGH
jgi:hypothetical protein